MSTTEQATPHLMQDPLTDNDKGILKGLEDWLSHAVFDPKSNICIDKSLGKTWNLLCEMDLIKKVGLFFQCQILADECLVHSSSLSN